jgi:hypothetical protein
VDDEPAAALEVALDRAPHTLERLVGHQSKVDRGACFGLDGVRRLRADAPGLEPVEIERRPLEALDQTLRRAQAPRQRKLVEQRVVDDRHLGERLAFGSRERAHLVGEAIDRDRASSSRIPPTRCTRATAWIGAQLP